MRILAGLLAFNRILFGIAFIARPVEAGKGWIGRQARVPGAQVYSRGFGARDVALGLGALQSLVRNDGSARSWALAQTISDATDFGATWVAGRRIPRQGRTLALAIAGGSTAIGLITAAGLGRRGDSEPRGTLSGEQVTDSGFVASEPVGSA